MQNPAINPEQEFLCGQDAARRDNEALKPERRRFPAYRTGAWITGYTSYWEARS